METLEEYLKENAKKGIIDFAFRCEINTIADVETTHICIHPDNVDGDTIDLLVIGNDLTDLDFNT